MTESNLTQLLDMLNRGDRFASEQLLPLVYDELRRLAAKKMAVESPDNTLQPTALVHEAFLRLVGERTVQSWENRGHFYAAAAEAMRRILIEAARRKSSLKRGGDRTRIELAEEIAAGHIHPDAETLLALDEALNKFAVEDPDAYKLVMLRYFGGLTVDEAAESLGISPRTAKRNWSFARAWLQREIGSE